MEEQFKRLAGFTARLLGVPVETVSDYVESDEAATALSKAGKDFRTKVDTEGYERGVSKANTKWEKALKARGVKAPTSDTIEESLDEVLSAGAGKDAATLSDEDALKLPAVRRRFTELENEKMQAVDAARREGDVELSQKRQAFQKEQQDAKVEAQARAVIAELNPNLNPDSAKAQRQVSRLLADIKAGSYKLDTDGTLLPIDAEGKLLDNGAGGSKSFAEHVREVVTSEYDLPAAQPRQMPQAGKPAGDGGTIKTKEDYDAAYIANQSNPAALDKLEADYPDFAK